MSSFASLLSDFDRIASLWPSSNETGREVCYWSKTDFIVHFLQFQVLRSAVTLRYCHTVTVRLLRGLIYRCGNTTNVRYCSCALFSWNLIQVASKPNSQYRSIWVCDSCYFGLEVDTDCECAEYATAKNLNSRVYFGKYRHTVHVN